MARGAPPEVPVEDYERRVLSALRSADLSAYAIEVTDTWLEGEHPDTKLVVLLRLQRTVSAEFVYRRDLWHFGSDSNPELNMGHIVVDIGEWMAGKHGIKLQEPGWRFEPVLADPGATARRPHVGAPAEGPLGRGDSPPVLPWPRPAESDPDLYERCLLSVFQGEWPGYRGQIEDAWLEGEYPHTELVLEVRLRDLPMPHGVFRTEVWRPPGSYFTHLFASDIASGQMFEWYREALETAADPSGTYEPRAAQPNVRRRRPRLRQEPGVTGSPPG